MRVKCPNSDVFLDLPDGRMDMKFSCPSCNRVHRVTISISTAGEVNTRSVTRQQLNMPKKYATGAYPPVVDIPIDADFILVEKSSDQTMDGSGGSGTAGFAPVESFLPPEEKPAENREKDAQKPSSAIDAAASQEKPSNTGVNVPPEPLGSPAGQTDKEPIAQPEEANQTDPKQPQQAEPDLPMASESDAKSLWGDDYLPNGRRQTEPAPSADRKVEKDTPVESSKEKTPSLEFEDSPVSSDASRVAPIKLADMTNDKAGVGTSPGIPPETTLDVNKPDNSTDDMVPALEDSAEKDVAKPDVNDLNVLSGSSTEIRLQPETGDIHNSTEVVFPKNGDQTGREPETPPGASIDARSAWDSPKKEIEEPSTQADDASAKLDAASDILEAIQPGTAADAQLSDSQNLASPLSEAAAAFEEPSVESAERKDALPQSVANDAPSAAIWLEQTSEPAKDMSASVSTEIKLAPMPDNSIRPEGVVSAEIRIDQSSKDAVDAVAASPKPEFESAILLSPSPEKKQEKAVDEPAAIEESQPIRFASSPTQVYSRSPSRQSATRRAYGTNRRKSHKGALIGLLVFLAGLGGVLFWQHMSESRLLGIAKQHIDLADRSYQTANIDAAVTAADKARADLNEIDSLLSPRNLASSIYSLATGKELQNPDIDRIRLGVNGHIRRGEVLADARRALKTADFGKIDAVLADQLSRSNVSDDEPLAKAVAQQAEDLVIEQAEKAATNTGRPEEVVASLVGLVSGRKDILSPQGQQKIASLVAQTKTEQVQRLELETRATLASIATAAHSGSAADVFQLAGNYSQRLADAEPLLGSDPAKRFAALGDWLADGASGLPPIGAEKIDSNDQPYLSQAFALIRLRDQAYREARSVLAVDFTSDPISPIIDKADQFNQPSPVLAESAKESIAAANDEASNLLRLRQSVALQLQEPNESRRSTAVGPLIAKGLLLAAMDDSGMQIWPSEFKFDRESVTSKIALGGVDMVLTMDKKDYERSVRAVSNGFEYRSGWSPLFHKPLSWFAELAATMQKAGVDPDAYPSWQVYEGPGRLLALSNSGRLGSSSANASLLDNTPQVAFFDGRLFPVKELPAKESDAVETFRAAARRLHEGVMADESIHRPLRQALDPILKGTYGEIDQNDFFTGDICRRLIEADYLEKEVKGLSGDRLNELSAYRKALEKVEAGRPEFAIELDGGRQLVALKVMVDELNGAAGGGNDSETGETLSPYIWRVEGPDETVFYSSFPARQIHALSLAEIYPGRHESRPMMPPLKVEVWHVRDGLLASYSPGEAAASGDAEKWNRALGLDRLGWNNPSAGPPGWDFPLHVVQRNDQGDPVALAVPTGVVNLPDFSEFTGEKSRREAQDKWLDKAAKILATPGELGLLFHQFSIYLSDSPLPEYPTLIGSRQGLGDIHQTVYETLDRKMIGRMIGDCDDLAEFFQELTRRQGKLSYVMQLPKHAACGYVDKLSDGSYQFVVLQTGPVQQFVAPDLAAAVEMAYRSFDREGGETHLTAAAVPLLLRFAGEQTRTPFVLSARIYADREYADAMIRVQSYWHAHAYSAAIKEMEEMLKTDQELGSIKELASLYQRVGWYDKSAEMRRRELAAIGDADSQEKLSAWLEMAQLYYEAKNNEGALDALKQMESIMREFIRNNNRPDFFRAMSFQMYWAMMMTRIGDPAKAWELLKFGLDLTRSPSGHLPEPILRTLVTLYEKLQTLELKNGKLTTAQDRVRSIVRRELESGFSRGWFRADDSYNTSLSRYAVLGRFAVAKVGRKEGIARLLADGPYPTGPREHSRRGTDITDQDWAWFRISPGLFASLGMEMLDNDELPEYYDPQGAKPVLEAIRRAMDKGAAWGAEISGEDERVRGELALSFVNNDINAFKDILLRVRSKAFSRLYDEAALSLGFQCGLIPLSEFPRWIEVFKENFPDKQHYFKVVYRAIDKEHYDHALMMAEATAKIFPDDKLLVDEAEFVKKLVPELKRQAEKRRQDAAAKTQPLESIELPNPADVKLAG